ncbi:Lysine histidine transporter-like 7 [Forsythia ovata]|uniref:Lysine histidine transporter-like 7 n=1 Tax=Forsythia ovata TaxID=205694 RepID=A0ABD1VKK9_9LAMI
MAEVVNVRFETVSSSARVAPVDEETGDQNKQEPLQIISISEMSMEGSESWLPITESRKGNTLTAALHLLCSGIGVQILMLPLGFVALGWFWGSVFLSIAYVWQLYTTWVLVHLHESAHGIRYSRYLHLSIVAFGLKLGKLLAIFPTMYLSGGTCVMFIINGGWIMELFYKIMCGDNLHCNAKTLTGAQWFLLFVCLSIFLSQFFPNLNSLSRVSLIGSIMAVAYCTMIWILSVSKGPEKGVSHDPAEAATSDMVRVRNALNGLGFIAFVFRGHNVVLEIQGTMRSNRNRPSKVPMWRGVTISYLVIIPMCLFPLAIVGYWAYGNKIPFNGGILSALIMFHINNTSKYVLGTMCLTLVIHYICAFQIYAMVVFDNLERLYVSKKNEPCPRWIRSAIRVFFGGLTYFISVAFPFLGSLGLLIGAIVLPLTLSYPCFMWIAIKKPRTMSPMWCLNVGLGSLGALLSVVLVVSSLSSLIATGLDANFFKPK